MSNFTKNALLFIIDMHDGLIFLQNRTINWIRFIMYVSLMLFKWCSMHIWKYLVFDNLETNDGSLYKYMTIYQICSSAS